MNIKQNEKPTYIYTSTFSCEHQDVTLYDLLTTDPTKDTYKGFVVATLKSSASTGIMAGKCPLEKENVEVCIIQGEKCYVSYSTICS